MKSFFEKLTKSKDGKEETFNEEETPQKRVVHFREEALKRMGEDEPREKNRSGKKERQEESPSPSKEEEGQLTVDVYQTDTEIVIQSTIAGVKPEGLDINITNDMVTIRGTREHDEKIPKENYFYQECYWGRFSRSIILPQDIMAEQAEASMKDGVLTIRLPKTHVVTSKKLKVKTV